MILAERIAALLLAGGLSRRFGSDDKLLSDFAGAPLARHARDALGDFGTRIAVVRSGAPSLASLLSDGGFALVENPAPERGMASSLRLGVEFARDLNIDAVLISLADMPRVDAALLARLCAAFDPEPALLVCYDGRRRSPPALIGRRHFDAIAELDGDAGARSLLAGAPVFAATPDQLLDIDEPGGYFA